MKAPIRLTAAAVIAYFGLSASAVAIPIGTVGPIDPLVAWTSLANSSEATEQAWVESTLVSEGYAHADWEINFSHKTQTVDATWHAVDGMDGVYAIELWGEPYAYLLKTGEGSKLKVDPGDGSLVDATDFLFLNPVDIINTNSVNWAVFDLKQMGFDPTTIDIFKVSHISEFDVPEPSALVLMALGLFGMAGVARRRKPVIHVEA